MSRYGITPRRRNLLGGLLSGLESRSDDGAGAADSRSFGSPGDKRRGPSSPSGLFSLLQPVGPNKPNRRRDVGRVESLLTASGHLKQGADHAPGRFSPALEKAVKGYQRDWKLKVDGLLNPAGPTLRAFKVQASRPLRPVPMDEVAGNRRTVDALLKSASLGMVPTLIADVHQSGGEKGRASLNDFFGQLKSLSPGKTTDLLEAANKKIARDGGRPLSFLDLPALAKPMGNDDDKQKRTNPTNSTRPLGNDDDDEEDCPERDKAEKALEAANSKLEEVQAILEEAQEHLEDLLALKEEAEECQKRKG